MQDTTKSQKKGTYEVELLNRQDKYEEKVFWNNQSSDKKYLTFEKKVYSAFRVHEYVEMIEKYISDYKLANVARVLDLGCSAGVSTIVWSKMGFDATGIDLSSNLISQARELAEREKSSVKFVVGDVSSMDFENDLFDVCFMVGLLHHFPDITPAVKEIHRVLKKDGVMIAVEPNLLNWPYRLSFYLVHKKKGVTPNEAPLSPLVVKQTLEVFFRDVEISQFRENDVPCLRQMGWFGKSIFGTLTKHLVLLLKNNFAPKICRGTFFMVSAKK
jgi:ubiquinone/menaquinone biosynthesis C-methylase UbiE